MGERMYYMQDSRQAVGNCALWWRTEAQGYTCDIDEAMQFTEKEAMDQHDCRETDIPFLVDDVRKHILHHVRVESLHQIRKDPNVPE